MLKEIIEKYEKFPDCLIKAVNPLCEVFRKDKL